MNIEKSFNEFYNKFLIENKDNFNEIEEQRKLFLWDVLL